MLCLEDCSLCAVWSATTRLKTIYKDFDPHNSHRILLRFPRQLQQKGKKTPIPAARDTKGQADIRASLPSVSWFGLTLHQLCTKCFSRPFVLYSSWRRYCVSVTIRRFTTIHKLENSHSHTTPSFGLVIVLVESLFLCPYRFSYQCVGDVTRLHRQSPEPHRKEMPVPAKKYSLKSHPLGNSIVAPSNLWLDETGLTRVKSMKTSPWLRGVSEKKPPQKRSATVQSCFEWISTH